MLLLLRLRWIILLYEQDILVGYNLRKNYIYTIFLLDIIKHLVDLLSPTELSCIMSTDTDICRSNLSAIERISRVLSTQHARCCRYMPRKYYIKRLVGTKKTHTKHSKGYRKTYMLSTSYNYPFVYCMELASSLVG